MIPIINWLEKNVIPDFIETAEGDEDFEVMLADIRDEIEGYMASPNFDSDVADRLIKTFDFNGHSMGFWRPASLPAYQRMIGRVSGICNKEDWLTPFLMQLYIDQMEKNVAQRNQTEIAETLAVLRLVMNHCGYSLKIITEEMKNIGYKSRDVAMISDILKGRQLK